MDVGELVKLFHKAGSNVKAGSGKKGEREKVGVMQGSMLSTWEAQGETKKNQKAELAHFPSVVFASLTNSFLLANTHCVQPRISRRRLTSSSPCTGTIAISR